MKKERETTDRAARDTGYKVAYSYHGLEEFAECQKIVIDLIKGRQSVLKKLNPQHTKMPAYELRSEMKEYFPNIEIIFTQPPDGIYYMADKEDFKNITQMWPKVRQFVLKFLNCESFTQLFRDYTKYFLFLPEILLMTYQCLVIASENPIVSIAANISNRSNVLAIALVNAVYSEFKFKVQLARRNRAIIKRLDKMVSYYGPSRSKP